MTTTSVPVPDSRATAIGATTVLNWALLATLTQLAGPVPPFLLTALAFAIAFACFAVWLGLRGESLVAPLRQPPAVWALGVGGLFGYHALYFVAQQNAPPANAGLISYLWPLLIVIFVALLPGERLKAIHLVGALLGFAGAALLVGGDVDVGGSTLGYVAAFACAFVWSGYSVLSRATRSVPTAAVGGFCLATALLAALCHLLFEPSRWPQGIGWLGVIGLGLGPVGSAFFTWDLGVKHGDLRLLGLLAYFTPLLSTLVLIAAGYATASPLLALAAILITLGMLVGSGWLRWPRAG
ncbi:EamA family transporter [Halomonas sp. M4R5S39]|uniref:EamA family transporter n=1 Tax=Halomonas heilongjiangensis TaxID=1387883 RepID=A0A2N7TLV5_9GAMM|nr:MULTISPECIES: EamA family transporter [Halomonas]MDI5984045.1 EamA family transporter [Halomonas kalidii]PMR69167.1 EamA family transporter [Halomonas heilongjiangensis]PXX94193.1 EamA family transporter [Halomonas heilongjiangensis]